MITEIKVITPKFGANVYAILQSDGELADLWGQLPSLDGNIIPDMWWLATWEPGELSWTDDGMWWLTGRRYMFFLAREFRAIAEFAFENPIFGLPI